MPESTTAVRKGDRRSKYQMLRRHIAIGGWFGNILFATVGVFFGFFIGGFGGVRFFEELFLIDLTGPVAALIGSVVGVITGTLSVWAILVIVCAFGGALTYLIRFGSFPSPNE